VPSKQTEIFLFESTMAVDKICR